MELTDRNGEPKKYKNLGMRLKPIMNQYNILNFKTNNGYIQIKGRYQYDSHDAAGPAAVSDASLSCKQKVSILCLPIITWYDYQTE